MTEFKAQTKKENEVTVKVNDKGILFDIIEKDEDGTEISINPTPDTIKYIIDRLNLKNTLLFITEAIKDRCLDENHIDYMIESFLKKLQPFFTTNDYMKISDLFLDRENEYKSKQKTYPEFLSCFKDNDIFKNTLENTINKHNKVLQSLTKEQLNSLAFKEELV
jgi:hypothetical protein